MNLHSIGKSVAAALVLGIALTGAAPAQTGYGNVGDGLRVRQAPVMDTQGFGRPIPAYTLTIPYHWVEQGGIRWGNFDNCRGNHWELDWVASSPDYRFGAALFPNTVWTFSPNGSPVNENCPYVRAQSARDFLTWRASGIAPDARVVGYRDRYDLLAEIGLRPGPEQNPPMGTLMSFDAGEVIINYSIDGERYEALMTAAVLIYTGWLPADSPNPEFIMVTGSVLGQFMSAAPQGQLNRSFAEMIRRSMAMTPEWAREISAYNRRLHEERVRQSSAAHRARMEAAYAANEAQLQAYLARSDTSDRNHRETMEQVRGVETWDDPRTGEPVQLDRNFSYAWAIEGGGYHVTNDAGFDPVAEFGVPGTQMQLTR